MASCANILAMMEDPGLEGCSPSRVTQPTGGVVRMGWVGMGWGGKNGMGLGWGGVERMGWGWDGVGGIGLGWTGLDGVGLGWVREVGWTKRDVYLRRSYRYGLSRERPVVEQDPQPLCGGCRPQSCQFDLFVQLLKLRGVGPAFAVES